MLAGFTEMGGRIRTKEQLPVQSGARGCLSLPVLLCPLQLPSDRRCERASHPHVPRLLFRSRLGHYEWPSATGAQRPGRAVIISGGNCINLDFVPNVLAPPSPSFVCTSDDPRKPVNSWPRLPGGRGGDSVSLQLLGAPGLSPNIQPAAPWVPRGIS